VPIGELAADVVGAALDRAGPPAPDVVDGEHLVGTAVHAERDGEAHVCLLEGRFEGTDTAGSRNWSHGGDQFRRAPVSVLETI